ncbi:hypothetical protein SAMN05444285_1619 [Draconibacterium orientale]|uniref:DUF5655 domain-containing protein n=1 Tax=Draconibacterium orientale TaxID=1168034 RepID=X5DUY0_9BACT|nr:hypothetical protein [Draconibacterium orientale]AHW58990.1 hypothetical protein FH5T_03605 [Draconibacterium orientale]SEU15645.1 hypothetical protein SAMN05444285_1619 [Draconibacterium orientale]
MESEIKIGKKIFIRNAGKDEYWLQDIIYENPKVLGLGDLVAVNKEKKQANGGRLDILLKEPTENLMYEVEVMLGETDPSHIIRSIEYWDNEKRKYPQRQHFCVLIAESFDRRYFNVIQLMSLNIPMIAIQADLLEVNGEKILNFSKIIDIYTEPEEDEEDTKQVNESTWNADSPWTNLNAKEIYESLKGKHDRIDLRYTQSYISINIDGRNAYWLCKRIKPTSALFFSVKDDEKVEVIKKKLEENDIGYTYNRYKEFMLNVDIKSLKKNIELLNEVHAIRNNKLTDDE